MIFEKIRQKILSIGITGKELKMLLFLLIILFIGLLIKTIKSANPEYAHFDYTSIDSVYNNLNYQPDTSDNKFLNQPDSLIISELKKREKTVSKLSSLANRKININKAGISELKELPGIGNKIANDIIEFREKKGQFKRAEDLMNVKGIGEKKFEKIKEYIILSN